MNYEELKTMVQNWECGLFAKTNHEKRIYFMGMARGADLSIGEYESIVKLITKRKYKPITQPDQATAKDPVETSKV